MQLPVTPNRQLGQHFLVDPNILGVIGRLAELESDRGLEPHLRERLRAHPNVELVFGDALTLPLDALDPAPAKLVANLPYQVATPVVVESLDRLPAIALWCVMVQREVADRFFAPSGGRSYGAVSVLIRLTAERTGFHPVARTCFQPPPNVDSALVAFHRKRRWGMEYAPLKELVQAAFAHRRKTLANSLEQAGIPREQAAAALAGPGVAPAAPAEQLEPEQF